MKNRYDAIYLSPHLDDAVLSCGGAICARVRRGESVLVATLAAGDAPRVLSELAQSLHAQWGVGPDASLRREEDQNACRRLGAEVWHGATPDCIYRVNPEDGVPLYRQLSDVFSRPHPADRAWAAWRDQIRALPEADAVVAPLGVGGHVDHILLRRAAEEACGSTLLYYEDFPYASRFLAVRRRIMFGRGWVPAVWELSDEDLLARCEASALYSSQVDMMVGGVRRLEMKIRSYVRRRGGERIWQRR
ncbi:MAG: PIG-L family deacetylase [Kiritimatiellae bacterium]|nr:PIG-L family deacetylase [Kiritimatiellia bacterium]